MQYMITFQKGGGQWPPETAILPTGTSRSQAIKLMRRAVRRQKYPIWGAVLNEVHDDNYPWPRFVRVTAYYLDRHDGYGKWSKKQLREFNEFMNRQ